MESRRAVQTTLDFCTGIAGTVVSGDHARLSYRACIFDSSRFPEPYRTNGSKYETAHFTVTLHIQEIVVSLVPHVTAHLLN